MNLLEKYKKIDFPVWKRSGIDNLNSLEKNILPLNYLDKVYNSRIKSYEFLDLQKKYPNLNFNLNEGFNEKLILLARLFSNAKFLIDIPKNSKIEDPIYLDFKYHNSNSNIIENSYIIANENSTCSIIINHEDDLQNFFSKLGTTILYAMPYSTINIFKLQSYSSKIDYLDSMTIFASKNSTVNIVDIQLGASNKVVNYYAHLQERSSVKIDSFYLGRGVEKLDLSFSSIFKAPYSNCSIQSYGALLDNSRKVFRGNLNFLKGSKKSFGKEIEYALILDKNIKSHSLPALWCTEDDVVGEHAASAGQIDSDKLFYLMSRGFSKKEAQLLLIEALLNPIKSKIPNSFIQDSLKSFLNSRLEEIYEL